MPIWKTHIELPIEVHCEIFEGAVDAMQVFLGHDNQSGKIIIDVQNLLTTKEQERLEDELIEHLESEQKKSYG